MEPKFQPKEIEDLIYSSWQDAGLMKADPNSSKKPFCIILPPPNANADLHLGHAMYVYEDLMIRYYRMLNYETLWLPGADHAGIETQYVFEKYLKKQGKSRFDYDRQTLFQMIWDFVMENRGKMEGQLKKLGFALDWEKKKFTLDEDIVAIVYDTFKKLFEEKLLYRDYRLVNYCTRCGTSFSDLEVVYIEKKDPLYYLKYGPFTIATVRPETKFRDTALAVNPKDRRYKKWLGKTLEIPGLLGEIKMTVIADPEVDPKFGTGIMKVTPAHDPHDFELGKKYGLPVTPIITTQGRMDFSWFLGQKNIPEKYRIRAEKYHNQKIAKARTLMVEDLKADGLLVKVDENYTHRIGTCYRDGSVIEPLPLEQWFIKVKPLVAEAKKIVQTGKIKIHPKRFQKHLITILDNFIDWNISRQIVWGIRIPAYKCQKMSNGKCQMSKGWFVSLEKPKVCSNCGAKEFEQDPDTFDTWFSSAQWPFATLMAAGKKYYDNFYPTSVMETGYDILRAWVARMIMIGYFITKKPPFKNVFLHGLIRDRQGQKMSKSKGNVVNPMEMIDKYGADALRGALIFNVKEGGDLPFSEEKVIGMRNFTNKIWNIGRFLELNSKAENRNLKQVQNSEQLNELKKELTAEKKNYIRAMNGYKFSQALGEVYEFLWHRFADYYIEELKDALQNGNIEVLDTLKEVYFENLKMLHPFLPFVTEAVWQVFKGKNDFIINSKIV